VILIFSRCVEIARRRVARTRVAVAAAAAVDATGRHRARPFVADARRFDQGRDRPFVVRARRSADETARDRARQFDRARRSPGADRERHRARRSVLVRRRLVVLDRRLAVRDRQFAVRALLCVARVRVRSLDRQSAARPRDRQSRTFTLPIRWLLFTQPTSLTLSINVSYRRKRSRSASPEDREDAKRPCV